MTSATGRNNSGFTLVEVLMAFAVLATGLTLVAAAFGRHLAVAQWIQDSLAAHRVADQRLVEEALRRESGIQMAGDSSSPGGFRCEWVSHSDRFTQEPVQEMVMDRATARVSWTGQARERSTQLVVGFAPQPGENPP